MYPSTDNNFTNSDAPLPIGSEYPNEPSAVEKPMKVEPIKYERIFGPMDEQTLKEYGITKNYDGSIKLSLNESVTMKYLSYIREKGLDFNKYYGQFTAPGHTITSDEILIYKTFITEDLEKRPKENKSSNNSTNYPTETKKEDKKETLIEKKDKEDSLLEPISMANIDVPETEKKKSCDCKSLREKYCFSWFNSGIEYFLDEPYDIKTFTKCQSITVFLICLYTIGTLVYHIYRYGMSSKRLGIFGFGYMFDDGINSFACLLFLITLFVYKIDSGWYAGMQMTCFTAQMILWFGMGMRITLGLFYLIQKDEEMDPIAPIMKLISTPFQLSLVCLYNKIYPCC